MSASRRAFIAAVFLAMLSSSQAGSTQDDTAGEAAFVREHLPGGRSMTKLFSARFRAGRPALNPAEESAIVLQTSSPAIQEHIRNSTATLVVIGYIDREGDKVENRRTAFRRAQMIIDLLRDKCGLAASPEAATLRIGDLPKAEQPGKSRTVEIWVVNP